jgi:hypothetical protein
MLQKVRKYYDLYKEHNKKASDYYEASAYYYGLYKRQNSDIKIAQEEDFPNEIILLSDIKDVNTNWSKHTVPYSELVKLQKKDDIIETADLIESPAQAASKWIKDEEPVIVVKINGQIKAYPISILLWNPVINDRIGEIPVAVTYCPLCNITHVFNRDVDGNVLLFGFSGFLFNSCVVFYDKETESLWDSLTGRCLAGDFSNYYLKHLVKNTVSFLSYKTVYPEEPIVVKIKGGVLKPISMNPYIAYDLIKKPMFFFKEIDQRLPVMERVVGLGRNDNVIAYPYSILMKRKIIHDIFEGEAIVIFYRTGMISPLSDPLEEGRDIGSTGVFSPYVDGKRLSFYERDNKFYDVETDSEWSILGRATSGYYEGKELRWILHDETYWFVWAAYFPDTMIYT